VANAVGQSSLIFLIFRIRPNAAQHQASLYTPLLTATPGNGTVTVGAAGGYDGGECGGAVIIDISDPPHSP
jgi:hypothetical protein